MMRVRAWIVGAALLSLATLVWVAGPSRAGEDDLATMLKIATMVKSNPDGGFKMAADLGKKLKALPNIMVAFKTRKADPPGIGVGPKPGAITPDGIELYINALQRDGIGKIALEKQASAIEDLAYYSAAVGEATKHFNYKEFGKGKKNKKDWDILSEKMRDSALKLAAAAKAKTPADVKTAAKQLNDACNACHSQFREKS